MFEREDNKKIFTDAKTWGLDSETVLESKLKQYGLDFIGELMMNEDKLKLIPKEITTYVSKFNNTLNKLFTVMLSYTNKFNDKVWDNFNYLPTKLEYNEIFSIIEKDNCDYSSNINGIFINLSNVEENTIDKIFNFLKFTKQKKKELKEKEFYIEDFKKNISEEESIKIHKKNSKQKNEYCDDLSSDEEEECTEKYIYPGCLYLKVLC